MIKAKLTQTCSACPSQWEGDTDKNEPVYIRFRWGYLSVEIGNESFGWQISDGLDGILSFEELKKELKEKLDIEEE